MIIAQMEKTVKAEKCKNQNVVDSAPPPTPGIIMLSRQHSFR
jgi:hypothetical protein